MSAPRPASTRQRGQAMVLMVLGLVAAMAMVGLIIDGGNAYVQQRATQNAADAAAEAGTVVLAQNVLAINSGLTQKTDADVLAALNASASVNAIHPFTIGPAANSVAYYTDILGNMITPGGAITTDPATAAQVGAGTIPGCTASCTNNLASGIRAFGRRDFSTYVSGIIGLSQFRATTQATAVTGYAQNPCDSAQGCALLPVTFAINITSCDGSGDTQYTTTPWTITTPPYTSANESILSLCKNGPGAVGWLDLGGAGNLAQQITTPTHGAIPIPTWLQTQPGNPNNLDTELSAYWGTTVGVHDPEDKIVLIPFFDGTCDEDRPDGEVPGPGSPTPFPGICVGGSAGNGNNTFYHIPYFIGFLLDRTYTAGNNNPECNQAPGSPFTSGNGASGCFKGWFVYVVLPPGPVSANPGPGGPNAPLTVQLIK